MDIILSKNLSKLGKKGELCKVKSGYAKNFLFPKQLALPASKKLLNELKYQKILFTHKLNKLRDETEILKNKLDQLNIEIKIKASKTGKIFGSIRQRAIENKLEKHGFNINSYNIKLKSPIKALGLHLINIKLKNNIKAQLKITVIPETI